MVEEYLSWRSGATLEVKGRSRKNIKGKIIQLYFFKPGILKLF